MDTHKNAALTPKGREMMVRAVVDFGLSKAAAARQFNTTSKTVAKWVERFEVEGVEGLRDPSSRPLSSPSQATPATCAAVEALRRQRHTGKQIAAEVGFRRQPSAAFSGGSASTGCRRWSRPSRFAAMNEPRQARSSTSTSRNWANSIESVTGSPVTGPARATPAGSAGNTCTWRSTTIRASPIRRILPDETRASCLRFLFNALRFFRSLGVKVERIMTDNGSSFRSRRYAKALRRLRIRRLRTRPYTPRTNGKAERFVQTSLREWAYARAYNASDERAAQLPIWLHRYNWHRPHGSLRSKPPISRLTQTEDNLLRLHT
jgi:transposase-like protein